MRFDIDTAQAKTMASRLQAFLAENPREKLTRSSAIEAVARMLGFNNRNEMLARLEAAPEAPAPAEETTLEVFDHLRIMEGLRQVFEEARKTYAKRLVEEGRKVLPDGYFNEAMHTENASGDHPLIVVEDEIAQALDSDSRRRDVLHAALLAYSEEEYDGAEDVRNDRSSRMAYALVNECIPLAEEMWDTPADEPNGP